MKHVVTIGHDRLEVEILRTGHQVDARVDGTAFDIGVTRGEPSWTVTVGDRRLHVRVVRAGEQVWVAVGSEIYRCTVSDDAATSGPAAGLRSPQVTAPMPGKVLEVAVQPGQHVEAGDTLVILEAMKMETVLTAEAAAEVTRVATAPGAMVEPGQTLVELTFD